MKQVLRLSSLALALLVTLALVATTTAPAQAQARNAGRPSQSHTAQSQAAQSQTAGSQAPDVRGHDAARHASASRPQPPGSLHAGGHVKPFEPHVAYLGHDYCGGWLHGPAWCLTFNKIEAGYVSAVSLAAATAFICGATALITCAVAAGIAAAIQRYVDRNGVCPNSRPKMRVEYFPRPGLVSCV
jgi:hypothetical protein